VVGFARNRRRYRVPWQHRYWQGRAKVVAWLRVVLAILACWLLFVVSYLGFAEPAYGLIAAARWSAAALLDVIGFGHWTWTVAASDGEQPWRSSFIRIDSWHLSQVEAVIASFWTAIGWAAGITLLGLSLTLAWWLGKRRATARYKRQPAVPAVQHLAAADDDNRPGLHAGAGERPAALLDDQEQDQPADQEEEPDIEGLFQQAQDLEEGDEARPRKPVARHTWDYRPC
jgi:hypothetical protein